MHDPSTNNSRLIAGRSGVYMIGLHVEWAASTAGDRLITIKHVDSTPTTTIIAEDMRQATAGSLVMPQTLITFYEMALNDYVESFATQTSGGNLDINASLQSSPEFWMQWVSPSTS